MSPRVILAEPSSGEIHWFPYEMIYDGSVTTRPVRRSTSPQDYETGRLSNGFSWSEPTVTESGKTRLQPSKLTPTDELR